jgi:hypothetical protein
MSGRDSHVFNVYGVRSVRLSAAVTKRCSDTAGEAFMQSIARTVTGRRKPFRPVCPVCLVRLVRLPSSLS